MGPSVQDASTATGEVSAEDPADELARLRRLVSLARLNDWRFDLATGRLEASGGARALLGLEPTGPLRLDTLAGLLAPEERASAEARVREAVRLGRPFELEVGTVVPLTVRAEPVVAARGKVQAWVGLVLQRPEARPRRTAAEEEEVRARLAESLVTMRAMVEARAYSERLVKLSRHLPGVVYQFQLFPDGRSCFPWASEGLRAIYGIGPEEVVTDATRVFLAVHPDDLDRVSASITVSATSMSRWQDEYRVVIDGAVHWVLGNATPEAQPDGSVLWHGYIFDITERKAFEAELVRAREAALDASRVKSEFLANMSHEIRTPLNGILGTAQLLLEGALTSDQHRLLDALRTSGQTLLALINDILDLSKVESGRLQLEQTPFAPREVLQRVVQTISVKAAEKGLLLSLDVHGAVPSLVVGDPTRVTQVLLNLAGNAVKFTERGEVRVVADVGPRGTLRVAVDDTGIGIAADQLPRLFSAFTQADGSITRRYGGTGLGLAISRQLAEHMGGTLTATSVEGRGSRFVVELPLPVAASERQAPVLAVAERPHAAPLNVLVAEDNAINALVVCTLLEREGHRVVHVTTGAAAIDAVGAQAFDVVLMDLQMPVLDGLEATRRIRDSERAAQRGGRLPIWALTASAMKGDIERCREAGMDDYLTKPVELAVLRQKLGAWSGERRVSAPAASAG